MTLNAFIAFDPKTKKPCKGPHGKFCIFSTKAQAQMMHEMVKPCRIEIL